MTRSQRQIPQAKSRCVKTTLRRGRKRTGDSKDEHFVNTRHFIYTLIVRLASAKQGSRISIKDLFKSIQQKHRYFAEKFRIRPLALHSLMPRSSLYRSYLLATRFQNSDVYIQNLIFRQEKGRKDTLRKCNDPELKDLYREPWCPEDAQFVSSVVRIKVTASLFYFGVDFHIRPRGSDDDETLDVALESYSKENVEVIVIDPNVDAHKVCFELPSAGIYVYYERDNQFMPSITTWFHQFMLHDIIGSKEAITDNDRAVSVRGGVNLRGRFGFIRTQPSDKGSSVSLTNGTHLFGSESVQGILEVGTLAQEAVKEKFPCAFPDESRNKYVSENMCKLMGINKCDWHWEYVDVVVTSGAKLIRHCDYVS